MLRAHGSGAWLQRPVGPVRLPDVPSPRLEAVTSPLSSKPIRPSTVSNWRLCMTSVTRSRSCEPAASTAWAQTCTAA